MRHTDIFTLQLMLSFLQHVPQIESPIVQKINIQDHLLGKNEEPKEKKSIKGTMNGYCFYLDGNYTGIYVDMKKTMRHTYSSD